MSAGAAVVQRFLMLIVFESMLCATIAINEIASSTWLLT